MSRLQPGITILSHGISSVKTYFRRPVIAVVAAVRKGINQPSTIPDSLNEAVDAFKGSSIGGATAVALVAYLIYTSFAVGVPRISNLIRDGFRDIAWRIGLDVPGSPEAWYHTIFTSLLGLAATGLSVIGAVIPFIILYFYIIRYLAQPENVDVDPPAPETTSEVPQTAPTPGIHVPIVNGRLQKPPGATYVTRRKVPTGDDERRARTSRAPQGSTSQNQRVPAGICGKLASDCRATERQFDDLLNLEYSVSAERYRKRYERCEEEKHDLERQLVEVREELKTFEDLVDPEVTVTINNLNAQLEARTQELAAARQQIEKERQEHEAAIKEHRTKHGRLLTELDESDWKYASSTEKWKRKLRKVEQETVDFYHIQRELTHYKKLWSEAKDREHQERKRAQDAMRRRDDLYKRATHAERKLLDVRAGKGLAEPAEPVMHQRRSGAWA